MHSSRMRTVRCSRRLLGGVCPGRGSAQGVSAQGSAWGVCLPRAGVSAHGVSAQRGVDLPPPVDRMKTLRKYYLSATSFLERNQVESRVNNKDIQSKYNCTETVTSFSWYHLYHQWMDFFV